MLQTAAANGYPSGSVAAPVSPSKTGSWVKHQGHGTAYEAAEGTATYKHHSKTTSSCSGFVTMTSSPSAYAAPVSTSSTSYDPYGSAY